MKVGLPPAAGYRMLSDEQIVSMARSGNHGATEFLLDQYRALVMSKARTFFVRGAEPEDVIQEGMIGLCKAIRDYREDRLSKFGPFAELCVTRQIISAVKSGARYKHELLSSSLPVDSKFEEGRPATRFWYAPLTAPDAEAIEHDEQRRCQARIKSLLSKFEQAVVHGFSEGKTYRELSCELDCEPKSVDNALQRARKKLARGLQN